MSLKKENTLTLEDVMCPICLDVLVEPITLGCNHEMCQECYNEHFEKADFSCPLCKKRLSTWARKATSKGTLINEAKWRTIQKEYRQLVVNRAKGNCNNVFMQRTAPEFVVTKPGEVHEEYVKQRQEWLNEHSKEQQEQEEASLRLIRQIQEEERADFESKRKKQQERDEKLARQLSKDLEMKVSPSRVNRIILRPRRTLSPISLNTNENSSKSRRRKSSTRPIRTTTRKRKRQVSMT